MNRNNSVILKYPFETVLSGKTDYPDNFSHIRLNRIIRQNFRFRFLLNGLLYTEFRIRFIPKRIAVLEYPVPFKRNE